MLPGISIVDFIILGGDDSSYLTKHGGDSMTIGTFSTSSA